MTNTKVIAKPKKLKPITESSKAYNNSETHNVICFTRFSNRF